MRLRLGTGALLAVLSLAGGARAQALSASLPAPGVSTAQEQADIANAVTAAQNSAASLYMTPAGVNAVLPPTCSAVLAPDTYGGTVGSAPGCVPRSDAARPTLVQSVAATTTASGTFVVTWPTGFASAPTYVHAEVYGGAAPYICDVTAKSTGGASGACYQLMATTLPSTAVALLGLAVSPFANAAAGLTIMVVGRQ